MAISQQRVFSVGDCVILNDCEQPSAKMVAVATYPDGWPRKWQDSELNHSWPMRADVFRWIGSA